MTISKELIRCKLAVNDQPIEQVMSFKYLGISSQNTYDEVKTQVNKAARVSGCLQTPPNYVFILLPSLDLHFVTFFLHLSSFALATCPAYFNLDFLNNLVFVIICTHIFGRNLKSNNKGTILNKSSEIMAYKIWIFYLFWFQI